MDALALGRYLRESRETLEISLDEVVEELKIRRAILESFEQGDFSLSSASDIQVRGFLRNYARFLNLDEDKVLQYYTAARYGKPSSKSRRNKHETQPIPVAPRRITDTPPAFPAITLAEQRAARNRSVLQTLALIIVSLAAIAIIIFVTSELIRSGGGDDLSLDENLDRGFIADLPPTSTYTPSPTYTATMVTPTASNRAQYSGQGVLVSIEITQRTWIQIFGDTVERYTGIAEPGDLLEYQATGEISLTASNAMGLDVIWNGEAQRQFGGRGQRVDITFTIDDVDFSTGPGFAPSPEQSPTTQPTPESIAATLLAELTPTRTPGPSPTPTDTLTPSDTPTITLTPSITFTPSNTPTTTNTPTETLTPTNTLIPSFTPPPTNTPTATFTPTNTLTPTDTLTPSITPTPSETAILPPRVTQAGLTPTKEGA